MEWEYNRLVLRNEAFCGETENWYAMNHGMDADMMEADSTSSPPPPPPIPSDQSDVMTGLLSTARQLIQQGNPSQALHAVINLLLLSPVLPCSNSFDFLDSYK